MQTVLETTEFVKASASILSDEERMALIDYVSLNPLAGDEIVGSGGVRKLRFGMIGRGKSGGARIIYFYYSESAPLYLLTCFAKSAKANLSDAEVRHSRRSRPG